MRENRFVQLVTDRRVITILVFVTVMALAYGNRFIQDDAFISFRYAANFASGHGLVWNFNDQPVEGYTNFLWTLLMSLSYVLHIEVVAFSEIAGLIFALGTFLLTYRLADLILKSHPAALLTVLLLGTNYTFSAYATGGLETQLQTFLFVASLYLAATILEDRDWSHLRFLALSVVCIAALMTRLDSAVLFVVLIPLVFWRLVREDLAWQQKLSRAASFALPVLVIIGLWFAWKLSFYGNILPNTFFAKVASATSLSRGFDYLYEFIDSYKLTVFVLLGLFLAKATLRKASVRLLLIVLAIWCAYVVAVGGDFMEFRFFVPVMPGLFILLVEWVSRLSGRAVKAALLGTILIGSWLHATTFVAHNGLDSIASLKAHLDGPKENWVKVGKVLNNLFAGQTPEVIIATTAAGAIPYYSQLTTIDMYGLNDAWIANNGLTLGTRPGHQKYAPYKYLLYSGVNLIVGYPQVESQSVVEKLTFSIDDLQRLELSDAEPGFIPETARIVEIPLDQKYKIIVLYLVQNDVVDRVIRENHFVTHALSS